jgi:hypothetical protein
MDKVIRSQQIQAFGRLQMVNGSDDEVDLDKIGLKVRLQKAETLENMEQACVDHVASV